MPGPELKKQSRSACKRSMYVNAGSAASGTKHRLQLVGLPSLDLFVHGNSFQVLVVLLQLHPASGVFAILQ